ncbi:MAG: hypothetical protein J6C96_11680 [Oscillospiraceae bacterium]|nr:hypothetical protein [Oscillospiraceae bacterium]
MVFSWELLIDGASTSFPFGNLRTSYSVPGMGTSGVCVGQFEFDLYDDMGVYSKALMEDSIVQLSCEYYTSPEYYVVKRSVSKKVCHFTCYNKLYRVDRQLDISGVIFSEDGTIAAADVLSLITSQCGFTGGYSTSGTGIDLITMKQEQLENITCRRALEMISEAMCGVWALGESDKLYLACLGVGAYGDACFPEQYSEIDYRGELKITALVMTNSDTGKEYRHETSEYGTAIDIDTPFASEALAAAVWERLNGYVYTAWQCDKAVITGDYPRTLTGIVLGIDGETADLFATDTTFDFDSTGIYFSGGAPPQDEAVWNYDDYIERRKLSIGKNVGNTAINANGDIVFKNLNKGGGLSGTDNGISIYRDENE